MGLFYPLAPQLRHTCSFPNHLNTCFLPLLVSLNMPQQVLCNLSSFSFASHEFHTLGQQSQPPFVWKVIWGAAPMARGDGFNQGSRADGSAGTPGKGLLKGKVLPWFGISARPCVSCSGLVEVGLQRADESRRTLAGYYLGSPSCHCLWALLWACRWAFVTSPNNITC